MKSNKAINSLIIILVIFDFSYVLFAFVQFNAQDSIEVNWGISIPYDYKELYSTSYPDVHWFGDGEYYTVRQCDEMLLQLDIGINDEWEIMNQDILSLISELLEPLSVEEQYMFNADNDLYYLFLKKSNDQIYLLFDSEAHLLYIIEQLL